MYHFWHINHYLPVHQNSPNYFQEMIVSATSTSRREPKLSEFAIPSPEIIKSQLICPGIKKNSYEINHDFIMKI